MVEFKDVGKVKLGKEVCEKRRRHGHIAGTFSQYPVVVIYAITCHKAEELTMPAVVLHSWNLSLAFCMWHFQECNQQHTYKF